MKRAIVLLITLVAASVSFAAPRRVALVVQNHTSNVSKLPVAALADTLAARLSGGMLHVINPHNAIGVNQNRTALGERMPDASAQEIGRLLNADGVVTASVLECTKDEIGVPPIAYALKVRIAINLADAVTGETVCGASNLTFSRNYTVAKLKADTASVYESLMHEAAAKCAEALLAKDSPMITLAFNVDTYIYNKSLLSNIGTTIFGVRDFTNTRMKDYESYKPIETEEEEMSTDEAPQVQE
ncbi:MAG: hypothetical protein J5938_03945 [Clostridia bacterium]|nr:hypothetical protein [Clostridia bacterium]